MFLFQQFKAYLSAAGFRQKHQIETNLSNDQIIGKVLQIALPSMMESVFIALIMIIDIVMISVVGHQAISAIGVTTQPRFIIMSLIVSLNMGVTVIISRRKGQKDQAGAIRVLKTALIISIFFSIILSLLGFFYAPQLMELAGANQDYLADAIIYFKIIMIGNIFYCISLTITAAMRGAGYTKISMTTNLGANLVNIFFNYLLINGIWIFPKWGVAGDAVATALGNFVALCLACYALTKKDNFLYFFDKHKIKASLKTTKEIIKVAYPALFEQFFFRLGFFLFTKQIYELGTIASTSHQITMNLMHLSFAFGDGLAIAATSLIGQSLGANKSAQAKMYGQVVMRFGRVCAIGLILILVSFRFHIIAFFTNHPQIVETASWLILFLSFDLFFQISQVITLGILRGAGDLKFVASLIILSVAIIRPGLTFIFAYVLKFGVIGAWLAVTIDQLTRSGISLWRISRDEWMTISI